MFKKSMFWLKFMNLIRILQHHFAPLMQRPVQTLEEAISVARSDLAAAEEAADNAAKLQQFCQWSADAARRDLDRLLANRAASRLTPRRSVANHLARRTHSDASRSPRRAPRREPVRALANANMQFPTHPLLINIIRQWLLTMPHPTTVEAWLSHLNIASDTEILGEYRKPGSSSMLKRQMPLSQCQTGMLGCTSASALVNTNPTTLPSPSDKGTSALWLS